MSWAHAVGCLRLPSGKQWINKESWEHIVGCSAFKGTYTTTQVTLEGKLSSINQSWKDNYQPYPSIYRLVKVRETGSKSVSWEKGHGKSAFSNWGRRKHAGVWIQVMVIMCNSSEGVCYFAHCCNKNTIQKWFKERLAWVHSLKTSWQGRRAGRCIQLLAHTCLD